MTLDYQSTGDFKNCTFRANTAGSSGGAVSITFAAVGHFENCLFDNNIASQFGGAVYVTGKSTATFQSCVFSGNKAIGGGATSVDFYSLLQVNRSVFDSNSADGEGGSIALSEFSTGLVDQTSFRDCRAVYGASLYVTSRSFLSLLRVDISNAVATYEGMYYKQVLFSLLFSSPLSPRTILTTNLWCVSCVLHVVLG